MAYIHLVGGSNPSLPSSLNMRSKVARVDDFERTSSQRPIPGSFGLGAANSI